MTPDDAVATGGREDYETRLASPKGGTTMVEETQALDVAMAKQETS